MIKNYFLSSYIYITKVIKPFVFLFVFVFYSGELFSQQVDIWLKADKAVNANPNGIFLYLPQPGVPGTFGNPGGDGTTVTNWYDVVYFTPSDGIPDPAPVDYPQNPPVGFAYSYGNAPAWLTPTGSIPGQPFFSRNAISNLNFNPVISFDGSGVGDALQFRSTTTKNVTVFIVFKARGAGNSAETQRLLLGGDVTNHHTSGVVTGWRTNLSLGIADNNRFSVGRTWFNDAGGYFGSGSIDLLAEPTIGVFSREATALNIEDLKTYVNGLRDISTIRNQLIAGNDLFFYNRLGKHFNSNNSNYNLTGDIAEILVADFVLNDNLRQRVESYLAVKYGITLRANLDQQLGSIVGNEDYNYLSADGGTIWTPDPVYKFDIAGIGVDRYIDILNGLSLRYNIDQRIAKSVNSTAIVTLSTNTDFSADNLDLTRPSLGNPNNKNYLLWSNDHASLAATANELPAGIDTRISREWKVQMNKAVAAPVITGVSIRMDLSGSDILTSACALRLLIDTDGNGDFTDGPITEILATSIDGSGNAYFDGIDFENGDVFTVGGIDPPVADTLSDVTECDSYTLLALTVGGGNYFTESGGTGTPLFAGDVITTSQTIYVYAETDGVPNCFDEHSFLVTINAAPDAGTDGLLTICEGSIVTAAQLLGALVGTPDNGGTWSPVLGGAGVYTYTVSGTAPCTDATAMVTVTEQIMLLADAPVDVESCDNYVLPALTNGNYFDAPNGGGNALSTGNVITTSQTVYVFSAGTGSCPDVENSFDVNIVNLNAIVQPKYSCEYNTLNIVLEDPSIASRVMYALDSTDPNDFILTPNFININPGEHFLAILHTNGCQQTIPFEIDDNVPLKLSLINTNINEITAVATGGVPNYTYYFDGIETVENSFNIKNTGNHTVMVVDENGCTVSRSIYIEFKNIEIPNFFTPNGDGQNDYWKPKNTTAYPKISTKIFDRYGREIYLILENSNGWDGSYNSKKMPTGDYWYIIKLNDSEDNREYVGHFTLYR